MPYSSGWITVPGKGRRWRTEDGEYLMQRPAGGMPGVLQAIQGALSKADQQLGGWLPGGGMASPVTRVVQGAIAAAPGIAKTIRDQALVPALDQGIGSGVLPTKEAMFLRYLTGTSKPLTAYPEALKRSIGEGFERVALDQTREQVDAIYKKENPAYRQLESVTQQANALEKSFSNRRELGGAGPSASELESLRGLRSQEDQILRGMNLSRLDQIAGTVKPDNAQRLEIIRRHGLASPDNVTVGYNAAYGQGLPNEVQLSLGSFEVRNQEVRDRYKFDNLEDGRTYKNNEGRMVYPDAIGGGSLASDLIELGLKSGVINPRSGYDIRFKVGGR